MVRVLVAEDSPTVRSLIVAMLRADPEIEIVGEARNGVEAVEMTGRLRPDVVTMDVNMPLLNGLDATKEIMARMPTPIVIVSSAADDPDVGLSLSATRAGALLVLPTPGHPEDRDFAALQAQFIVMIKAMAEVKVVRHRAAYRQPIARAVTRATKASPIQLVTIAASTGGPAALLRVLSDVPREFPPVLIVQHIARGFVAGLCSWLSLSCNLRVKIAEHGEPLARRTVFLAPDDYHLGVADGQIQLTDGPAMNGFRPSATHLFESAAAAYGSGVAAVILTGMGNDGVAGLRAVNAAGGPVIAQDENTCVVYGMPREAIHAGVVEIVLPLEHIGGYLTQVIIGRSNEA